MGPGHSFPTMDGRPLPGTEFEGFLVYVPMTVPGEVAGPLGKSVRLLSLVPLYRAELELKIARGTDELVGRIEESAISEPQLWEPQRPDFGAADGRPWKRVWS